MNRYGRCFRPHLLITEDDVEAIENKKQAQVKTWDWIG